MHLKNKEKILCAWKIVKTNLIMMVVINIHNMMLNKKIPVRVQE